MDKYLQIGKIVNTHGFRGDVKLQAWSDGPRDVVSLKRLYRKKGDAFVALDVEKSSVHKGMVLIKFSGVDDFDSANMLREEILYVDRDDLVVEEGAFFIADIIGLDVIDADDGRIYGVLKDVLQYGAHDIYTVESESGEVMVPAVSEFVKRIVPGEGIYIKPIEGMFDEI